MPAAPIPQCNSCEELFCAANDVGTHFLVRTSANRLAEDGTTKTEAEMGDAEVAGASSGVNVTVTHRFENHGRGH